MQFQELGGFKMSDDELLANIYTRLITEKVSYRVVCK